MVTFCLGAARQKREYFKNKGMLVLDNVEVLFCASENGKNYFVYGEVPFSEFAVECYIKYRRALCGGDTDLSVLARIGVPIRKRFGKLCEAERRAVMLAEKTGGAAVNAPVLINLDGARYSRKNMRVLDALIRECGSSVYVCVTDKRFLKHASAAHGVLNFGKTVHGKVRAEFYAARLLKKRLGATRVAVM